LAENTRDDVVCCRLVWLLPGRKDDRPVEVDGTVVGKEDGAGKVILSAAAAAAGCSADDDASAGDGDLARAAVVRFAGRCSSSSSSGSASISASSPSSCSCSCSARVCFLEPLRVFLAGGAGEGDLGCC
jgi:hypothetical protein